MDAETRNATTSLTIFQLLKPDLLPPLRERRHIDEAELLKLSDSLVSQGFIHAIVCTRDNRIVTGHRRWQAAMRTDSITHVPVRYVDDLSAVDLRLYRINENVKRQDYAIEDMCEEIEGLLGERPGTTQKEAAKLLNIDASTVTRFLSFRKCIPAVQVAADELGIKALYDFSKESPERQAEWLAEKQAGGAAEAGPADSDDGTVQAAAGGSGLPRVAPPRNGKAAASGKPRPATAADEPGEAPFITILLSDGKRVVVHGVATPGEAAGLLAKAARRASGGKLLTQVKFEELCRKAADAADAKSAAKRVGPGADTASPLPAMQERG